MVETIDETYEEPVVEDESTASGEGTETEEGVDDLSLTGEQADGTETDATLTDPEE